MQCRGAQQEVAEHGDTLEPIALGEVYAGIPLVNNEGFHDLGGPSMSLRGGTPVESKVAVKAHLQAAEQYDPIITVSFVYLGLVSFTYVSKSSHNVNLFFPSAL